MQIIGLSFERPYLKQSQKLMNLTFVDYSYNPWIIGDYGYNPHLSLNLQEDNIKETVSFG